MRKESDAPNAIADEVGQHLVQEYLSGLRGYPLHEDGQRCLGRHLAKYCLSVSHAKAILSEFTDLCPTPREIYDVAYNPTTRAGFLPPERPLKEQWEAEGCTYDATYYQRMVQNGELKMPKSGQPTELERLYRAVKAKLRLKDFSKVSIGQIWSTARDMGFPLNSHQREAADMWERAQPVRETAPATEPAKVINGARLITQADIDALRRKRAAESKGSDHESEAES